MTVDVRKLVLLTREGLFDAARRRIVPVLLAICFFSLALMNSCTSCSGQADVQMEGQLPFDILGVAGIAIYVVLGLWCVVLAALLAADHLAAMLDDDTALLLLSRPVSRATLALSRLLGSLGVSLSVTLVLLGGTSFFMVGRSDLSPGPALLAILATVPSSVTVASLAMAMAFYLPRVGVFAAAAMLVGVVSTINLVGAGGGELHGLYWAIDAWGPPLASGIVAALVPWTGQELAAGIAPDIVLRSLLWMGASVGLLLALFERRELGGGGA